MLYLSGATKVAPRALAAQTAGSEPHSADGLQREVTAQIGACALRYAKRARSPGFVREGLWLLRSGGVGLRRVDPHERRHGLRDVIHARDRDPHELPVSVGDVDA